MMKLTQGTGLAPHKLGAVCKEVKRVRFTKCPDRACVNNDRCRKLTSQSFSSPANTITTTHIPGHNTRSNFIIFALLTYLPINLGILDGWPHEQMSCKSEPGGPPVLCDIGSSHFFVRSTAFTVLPYAKTFSWLEKETRGKKRKENMFEHTVKRNAESFVRGFMCQIRNFQFYRKTVF